MDAAARSDTGVPTSLRATHRAPRRMPISRNQISLYLATLAQRLTMSEAKERLSPKAPAPAGVLRANRTVFETMLGRIDGRVYYNLLNWY